MATKRENHFFLEAPQAPLDDPIVMHILLSVTGFSVLSKLIKNGRHVW